MGQSTIENRAENFYNKSSLKRMHLSNLLEVIVDKNKVADLARSFSSLCKQTVQESQITQKMTSPAVTLLALTIFRVISDNNPADKSRTWW
jgi:hypothetical protein